MVDWIQTAILAIITLTLLVNVYYALQTRRMVEATVLLGAFNIEAEWHKMMIGEVETAGLIDAMAIKHARKLSTLELKSRYQIGTLFLVFAWAAIGIEKGMLPKKYWDEIYSPWLTEYKNMPQVKDFWQEWGHTFPERLRREMKTS